MLDEQRQPESQPAQALLKFGGVDAVELTRKLVKLRGLVWQQRQGGCLQVAASARALADQQLDL